MATSGLQNESRRRLPQAPNIDLSVRSNEIIQSRISLDTEQKQNMSSIGKKRLTPEVVAMLLSLDYDNETTAKANKVMERGISSGISQASTAIVNTKIILQGNVGLVNIVKTSGQPLGFSLREYNVNKYGEQPGRIYVSRLTSGGIAEENSLLSTGDEILEINRVSVKDYKLSDVVAMIQIPKKLTLKVRFRRAGEIAQVSNSRTNAVQNVNNNYIVEPNHGVNSQGIDLKQSPQIKRETAQGALKFRRNSSGRILPARPELELNNSQISASDNQSSSHISTQSSEFGKPNYTANFNTQYNSNPNVHVISKNNNLTQTSSQTHVNKELLNMNIKSNQERSTREQRRQKKSTVMPVTANVNKHSQIRRRARNDFEDVGQKSTRIDPGDIKFDIIATNDRKYSKLDTASNVSGRTLDEIKNEPVRDSTSKSGLRKTSEAFGSSSSLSSSDSPRPECKKKNSSSTLGTSALSRSEMLTHSSRLSDGSPVSSSAENEDQQGKGDSSRKHGPNQRPPFLHSLSSGDLNQSHNSWFSKIGNQKRKHVRKFSEGQRPVSKTAFGEPYRIQEESKDVVSNDGAEHGYRLYQVSPQDSTRNSSRAVTGMLTLDIIKGAQIGSTETVTKEKRKKTKVFCTVDFDGVRQACTMPKKGLNDFQWNESFEMELQRTREIRITVCSHSKKEDVKLAEGCLNLAQLLSEGNEHLLAVCLQTSGMLCVKLKFTDMKFLLQRTPSQKKEGVFGFPLETVMRRENSRIPNLIRKCVEEINERGLQVTGIYRLCGNAAKKKILRAQFENNSENVDLSNSENPVDVNIITGLLKDYLRELPQPIISQDVRELLCEKESESELSSNLVSQILKKFAPASKATIMYLLDHFVTVLMNSDANKMDSHNLAVCIGPVLLCPSLGETTNATVSDTKKDINAIKLLLEIWPKPEQVSAC